MDELGTWVSDSKRYVNEAGKLKEGSLKFTQIILLQQSATVTCLSRVKMYWHMHGTYNETVHANNF